MTSYWLVIYWRTTKTSMMMMIMLMTAVLMVVMAGMMWLLLMLLLLSLYIILYVCLSVSIYRWVSAGKMSIPFAISTELRLHQTIDMTFAGRMYCDYEKPNTSIRRLQEQKEQVGFIELPRPAYQSPRSVGLRNSITYIVHTWIAYIIWLYQEYIMAICWWYVCKI